MPDQGSMIREIERLTRVYLPISKLPDLTSFISKQVGVSETYKDNYSSRRGNRPSFGRFGHAKRRY
jgi:hypothetical protein